MIIGLLEAETLSPKVVEQFGSYGDMFTRLLRPLSTDLGFRYYAVDRGQLPRHPDECHAYIVTGSRHDAYGSDPWIQTLKGFIRELDEGRIKCLGICFGHQVIAEALGGRVGKSEKGWGVGRARFSLCERPPWMPVADVNTFDILVSHQDQVEALPPTATRCAQSDFCPNGGYFVGNHFFCLQGHPEFNKSYVRFLIDKRKSLIGEAPTSEALNSLQLSVDRALLQQWLAAFFQVR